MRLIFRGSRKYLSPAWEDYTAKRLGSLEKLIAGIPSNEIKAEVWLGKITGRHHEGKIWQVKVNLSFPGQLLQSSEVAEDPQEAVDLVKDDLRQELTKLKGKIRAELLRGSRRAKKDFHFSSAARMYRKGRIRDEAR